MCVRQFITPLNRPTSAASKSQQRVYGFDGEGLLITQMLSSPPTPITTPATYTQSSLGTPSTTVIYYDPFGVPDAGVAPTVFGFDGELQNGQTDFIDLRTRTYNPATAQFLTRDPLMAMTQQPYTFASDDPVDNNDPSGACTIKGQSLPGVEGSGRCDLMSLTREITSGTGRTYGAYGDWMTRCNRRKKG